MSFEQYATLVVFALIGPHLCKEWAFILSVPFIVMALMGMLMA